jgi:hypothetical protein
MCALPPSLTSIPLCGRHPNSESSRTDVTYNSMQIVAISYIISYKRKVDLYSLPVSLSPHLYTMICMLGSSSRADSESLGE